MSSKLLGGVEAGGTKMVCAVAYEPGEILNEERFPTTDSDETLARVVDYFQRMAQTYGLPDAIGYGTFGPASVCVGASDYGSILNTPKQGWGGVDVIGFLKDAFSNTRFAFDTDVNAAALGEGYAGASQGEENYIYVTVGTGIGGGVVMGGRVHHGRMHAEIGHMLIPIAEGERPDFKGACPFHGRCLEGLASGTAMSERRGVSADMLDPGHEAWKLEAFYLAAMVQNLVACYAPEKIILGGGVMEQGFLLDMVKVELSQITGGYWQAHKDLLTLPALGDQAGITGALLMASAT